MKGCGDTLPHMPTCQAGRTFSVSFRLIPSPSSSFPFPHLYQKRHKGIERMVLYPVPAWQAERAGTIRGYLILPSLKASRISLFHPEEMAMEIPEMLPSTPGPGNQASVEDKGLM